jgi:hypothetical protein
MFGFIGRVLPYLAPLIVWYYLNQALDKLESRRETAKQHPVWGKFWFLYGWAFGVNRTGTVVRYVLTGIGMFMLARWFFIITSTTPPMP